MSVCFILKYMKLSGKFRSTTPPPSPTYNPEGVTVLSSIPLSVLVIYKLSVMLNKLIYLCNSMNTIENKLRLKLCLKSYVVTLDIFWWTAMSSESLLRVFVIHTKHNNLPLRLQEGFIRSYFKQAVSLQIMFY